MHRWEDIKHKYCPHGSRWPGDRVYSRCSRCEEAAVVFGIIALGTWAAERDREHHDLRLECETLAKELLRLRPVAEAAEKHIRRHEQPESEQGTTYLKLEAAVVAWTGRPKCAR